MICHDLGTRTIAEWPTRSRVQNPVAVKSEYYKAKGIHEFQ